MTIPQTKRLYFPTWRRCFTAAWQVLESGRIVPAPDAPDSDARDLVEAHARTFAALEVRGVTETDLRHAATALSIQRARSHRARRVQPLPGTPETASSKQLDSLGLDLFRALCALIADPLWLGTDDDPGLIWWDNPELAERHRTLVILDTRSAPGYAAGVCANLYGTRDYHTLRAEELSRLYRLLLDRPHAWQPDRGRRTAVRPALSTPHSPLCTSA
jgi:hypothetical protein